MNEKFHHLKSKKNLIQYKIENQIVWEEQSSELWKTLNLFKLKQELLTDSLYNSDSIPLSEQ